MHMGFIMIWAGFMVTAAFFVLRRIAKCKKPFGMALRTSLSGIAAMMIVNALQAFTGVAITINYVTVSLAVLLGLPGTILMLIIRAILTL